MAVIFVPLQAALGFGLFLVLHQLQSVDRDGACLLSSAAQVYPQAQCLQTELSVVALFGHQAVLLLRSFSDQKPLRQHRRLLPHQRRPHRHRRQTELGVPLLEPLPLAQSAR
jgi:hypothetical protein